LEEGALTALHRKTQNWPGMTLRYPDATSVGQVTAFCMTKSMYCQIESALAAPRGVGVRIRLAAAATSGLSSM